MNKKEGKTCIYMKLHVTVNRVIEPKTLFLLVAVELKLTVELLQKENENHQKNDSLDVPGEVIVFSVELGDCDFQWENQHGYPIKNRKSQESSENKK